MTLQTIDKPNLYFAAQLLVNHLEAKIIDGHANDNQIQYHLFELKQVFRDNIASTTTHLEAIADLSKTYVVYSNDQTTDDGVPLVTDFLIHADNNTVNIHLHPTAVARIKNRDFHIKAVD
jgi:hypothetical protein